MTTAVRHQVPYVTAYDGEDVEYQLALAPHAEATDGFRLSYADAVAQDWMFGVLWHRHGTTRAGQPQWKLVNTARQRRCMLHLLCQVCGRSAVDDDGRIWWVLVDLPPTTALDEPFTNAPPTCRECIPAATRMCPRLRQSSHIYTAAAAEPYAVVADTFRPAGRRLVIGQTLELPLEAFHDLEYALAKQLVVLLGDLRPASPAKRCRPDALAISEP
ncbi:hypothetical protein [Nonomuraea sp. B1E8]|uniref:hypothetical protein n=1 Tax=unclassified Nonomuraea TaxID=2593643 RepID=UPI00325ECF2E